MKIKKLWISALATTTAIAPVTAIVACSTKDKVKDETKDDTKEETTDPNAHRTINLAEVTTIDAFMDQIDAKLNVFMPVIASDLIKDKNVLIAYTEGITANESIILKNGTETYEFDLTGISPHVNEIKRILANDLQDTRDVNEASRAENLAKWEAEAADRARVAALDIPQSPADYTNPDYVKKAQPQAPYTPLEYASYGTAIGFKFLDNAMLPEIAFLTQATAGQGWAAGISDYMTLYDTTNAEIGLFDGTWTKEQLQAFADNHPYIKMLRAYHEAIWKLVNSDFYKSWVANKQYQIGFSTSYYDQASTEANYVKVEFAAGQGFDHPTYATDNGVLTGGVEKHGENNETELNNFEAMFGLKLVNATSIYDDQATYIADAKDYNPATIKSFAPFANVTINANGTLTSHTLPGLWYEAEKSRTFANGLGYEILNIANDSILYLPALTTNKAVIYYQTAGLQYNAINTTSHALSLDSFVGFATANMVSGKPTLVDVQNLPAGWSYAPTLAEMPSDAFFFTNHGQIIFYNPTADGYNADLAAVYKVKQSMMHNDVMKIRGVQSGATNTYAGTNLTEFETLLNGTTTGTVTSEIASLIQATDAKFFSLPSELQGVDVTYSVAISGTTAKTYAFTFTYAKNGQTATLKFNLSLRAA